MGLGLEFGDVQEEFVGVARQFEAQIDDSFDVVRFEFVYELFQMIVESHHVTSECVAFAYAAQTLLNERVGFVEIRERVDYAVEFDFQIERIFLIQMFNERRYVLNEFERLIAQEQVAPGKRPSGSWTLNVLKRVRRR